MKTAIQTELKKLKAENLYRQLKEQVSKSSIKGVINSQAATFFASNDYLGLATHTDIKKASIAAIEKYGNSTCAARLITGNHQLYKELESSLAEFKNKEAAIVFPTGYMANLGLLSALASQDDIIYMDKLNHASLYDGCRLNNAKIRRYPHNNAHKLQEWLQKGDGYRRRIIVTDSVFSMDGDLAPLKQLNQIAKEYDCSLIADDAHGTGVLGVNGKGTGSHLGVEIDIEMGTLSKAVGSLGGFVAGSQELIDYLVNKSRPFIFTTGLPPSVLAASIAAIKIIQKEEWRRKKVLGFSNKVRKNLEEAGYQIPKGFTPIIVLIIGDEKQTLTLAERCLSKGVFIPAIRNPAVGKGEARLRMTVSATHTEEEVDDAIETLISSGKELKIIG